MEISEQSVSNWADLLAKVAIPDEPPMGAVAGVAPPFYQVPSEQKWVTFEIKPIEERRRLLADAIRTALAGFVVVPREQSELDADMLLSALQGKCPCCRWPLKASVEEGCILGNCSYRPGDHSPEHDGWLKRAKRSRELLLAAAALAPQERT